MNPDPWGDDPAKEGAAPTSEKPDLRSLAYRLYVRRS